MSRRLTALLMVVLVAGCVRRWEDKVAEVGSFVVVNHWIEENFIETRSGVDYREICNRAKGDCYIKKGWDGNRRPRDAWILFSQDNKYAAVYYDNVAGKRLESPVFSIYDSQSGRSLECFADKGDGFLKGLFGVAYSWQGDNGVGKLEFQELGERQDVIFFLSLIEGGCEFKVVKVYAGAAELGYRVFSSSSMEAAWGVCEGVCNIVVINVITGEEWSYPIDRCAGAPYTGNLEWTDEGLIHHCSGERAKRLFKVFGAEAPRMRDG